MLSVCLQSIGECVSLESLALAKEKESSSKSKKQKTQKKREKKRIKWCQVSSLLDCEKAETANVSVSVYHLCKSVAHQKAIELASILCWVKFENVVFVRLSIFECSPFGRPTPLFAFVCVSSSFVVGVSLVI